MSETKILSIQEAMEITQEIPEIFAQLVELYDAEVEFVELGIEGDQIVIREVEKSNPTVSSVHVPSTDWDRDKLLVSKAVDDEKRYTLAPWYVPDVLDAHDEWTDKDEVQRAFWDYLGREDRSIRLQHNMDIVAGEWVEGLTWPHKVTVPIKHPDGDTEITFPAGTPFLGVIWEPWAWELIKNGEIRGLSIGGRGRRMEADPEDYDYDPMGKVTFAKMIRTEGSKYVVYSDDGSRSFGSYDTKEEAEERLRQIEYFAKADFKVGDFVSWNSSGGRARGKIDRIEIDGEINVPDSSFTITGTNEEPAALITVWREGADGWNASDRKVGHKLDALTPIDTLKSRSGEADIAKHGDHDQSTHAGGRRKIVPLVNDDQPIAERSEGAVKSAKDIRKRSEKLEPEITDSMMNIAEQYGGEFVQLDQRLKTTDSLARKIDSIAKNEGMSTDEAATTISDSIRYTMTVPSNDYTAATGDLITKFESQGYDVEAKNYWPQGDSYQGINMKLRKDGITTEFQLHTPESYETKSKKLHDVYKKFRTAPMASASRKKFYQQMVDIAAEIPLPANYDQLLGLGVLVVQTIDTV